MVFILTVLPLSLSQWKTRLPPPIIHVLNCSTLVYIYSSFRKINIYLLLETNFPLDCQSSVVFFILIIYSQNIVFQLPKDLFLSLHEWMFTVSDIHFCGFWPMHSVMCLPPGHAQSGSFTQSPLVWRLSIWPLSNTLRLWQPSIYFPFFHFYLFQNVIWMELCIM